MLRLSNLKAAPGDDLHALKALCASRLKIDAKEIRELIIIKKSIDARDKQDVHCVYTLDVRVLDEGRVLKRLKSGVAIPAPQKEGMPRYKHAFQNRPIVVGAGPAGLFAAYLLALNGANPVLVERGRNVDTRTLDVERFFKTGELDEKSNVQFGEGGAGAFSDGKLTTGTKNPFQRFVLETFAACGAPEEILYQSKPHIGTDKLTGVVKNLREKIIALGGTVLFETTLVKVKTRGGAVDAAVFQKDGQTLERPCDTLILAIGHSARDTYRELFNQGVNMAQKPFAMGVRIEQLQARINLAQYGDFSRDPALGAADYKLNAPTRDGRGAYTFCMCPGGVVVAAASQPGGVVTNGMSYHARGGLNANAALLVGVRTEDFQDDHPLAGLILQRSLEQAAFRAGGGGFKAPAQRVEDFLNGRSTTSFGEVIPSYRPGVTPAQLDECLPEWLITGLREGLMEMDKRLNGFAAPDAVLTGVETRSSSPVRIPRDTGGQSNIAGLFPAGEGAGYAGGIMSAATDGLAAARLAMERSLCL